jgi:hypothetical protein
LSIHLHPSFGRPCYGDLIGIHHFDHAEAAENDGFGDDDLTHLAWSGGSLSSRVFDVNDHGGHDVVWDDDNYDDDVKPTRESQNREQL